MTIRVKSIALLLAVFTGLAGCGTVETDRRAPVQTKAEIARSEALLTRYLSGNTLWVYSDPAAPGGGHGTQVEFNASNGKTFLWYPGNSRPVVGQWKVDRDASGSPRICYLYPPTSYNPVTRLPSGSWDCTRATWVFLGDSYKGDVFGLGSGRLPFTIPDRKFYLVDDLLRMMGKDPSTADMITNIGEL